MSDLPYSISATPTNIFHKMWLNYLGYYCIHTILTDVEKIDPRLRHHKFVVELIDKMDGILAEEQLTREQALIYVENADSNFIFNDQEMF